MPITPSSQQPYPQCSAVDTVRMLAKALHRAARADALPVALPVLRRLIASHTLNGITLPALHRQRAAVQRKHLLCMLAIEAGHPYWEAYRGALSTMRTSDLPHFDLVRGRVGYPNLWFASVEEAARHVRHQGGRAITVGHQAVVIDAA